MLKISKFRQPNMSHHPTSSTPLSRWSDPSWIHWHLIIKHNFNMVCTSPRPSIFSSKELWNISWRIRCFFYNSNKEHIATSELWTLHQGSHPTFVYASKCRQLAYDISWDEVALVNQFQFGLCGDVKDLLLTMLDPTTLNQTITQVVRCDNQLFECW